MQAKTMEGLVGASTNMNLLNTPMRVFNEARRRGDQATMERAMDYVGQFADQAAQYQVKAKEGMEEDAREAREKEKADREQAVEKRREEQRRLEEEQKERREHPEDILEVSEEGKALAAGNAGTVRETESGENADGPAISGAKADPEITLVGGNISVSV